MLAAASAWLRHLSALLLLAVFLEAVLPRSGMQKYVRVVLGLVVVLTLLAPVKAFLSSGFDAAALARQLSGPLLPQAAGGGATSSLAIFRADLEQALREEIAATLGVELASVTVQAGAGGDGAPAVTAVRAYAQAGAHGPVTRRQALAVKLALAAALGISGSQVAVSYAGGSV